jgi:glycosyltransferase involved in cell wall biosynthesis
MSTPNDNPLVSIVTPSFNQAEFIEMTLQSVLRQAYEPIEYIVIDGASTDGSREIIEKYSDQLDFWISEPDQGQVDAINKGLQRASGEIVAWINSDDMYVAGAVQEAVTTLREHPNVGMVYGDGIMVNGSNKLLDLHTYRTYEALDLLCFDVLLQPTVFMRREVLNRVGLLSTDYHMVLDHDLWIRIAAKGPILHVPSYWAVERTHEKAKTVAQTGTFVEEAAILLHRAESSPVLGDLINANDRKVRASLHAFAARRMIDGGEHKEATSEIFKAFFADPRVGFRYWYKALQASLSAVGLGRLFLAYRNVRRRIQHRKRHVVMTENGPVLST